MIIFVTLTHVACSPIIDKHARVVTMCAFFFFSGYLYRNPSKSLTTFYKKAALNILLPFFLWSLVSSIFDFAFGGNLYDIVVRLFVLKGDICWNSPLWFLIVLFFAEIVFVTVDHFNQSLTGKIVLLVVSLAIGFLIAGHKLPFLLDIVPYGLTCYCIGNIVKKISEQYTVAIPKLPKILLIIGLGIMTFLFGVYLNGQVSYVDRAFGNYLFCVLAAVSGTFFYILLFQRVPWLGNSKFFTYLGRSTMIIFAGQYFVFRIGNVISNRLFNISIWFWKNDLKGILLCAFTIAILCGVCELIRWMSRKNKAVSYVAGLFGIR